MFRLTFFCYHFQSVTAFGAALEDRENNPFDSHYSFASSIVAPKEVIMLDTCSAELRTAAQACIKAVSECFDSRKTIYLTQLKKIRETSNMATRNAVQHERSEAALFINRLKEAAESQRRKDVNEAQERIAQLQTQLAELRATADASAAEVTRLTGLEQNRHSLLQTAVSEAVSRCKEEGLAERLRHQELAANEQHRLQAEAQSIVDNVKAQMEVSWVVLSVVVFLSIVADKTNRFPSILCF